MAETLDIIRKLMALALNNPNEAEATSAALKAIKLIQSHHITIGDSPYDVGSGKKYRPPDPDFMDIVEDILKSKVDPDKYQPLAVLNDTEFDDDFMRKRITLAWQAIREERKRLEVEWQRLKDAQGYSYGGGRR